MLSLMNLIDYERLTVSVALKIVIKHWRETRSDSHLHVFLGIDEIIRIKNKDHISDLLSEIGVLLETDVDNQCSLFSCLVTSLDAQIAKKSGRAVDFIPLWELHNPEQLFSQFTNINPKVLSALIKDCGGHPKTLDILFSILKETKPWVDVYDYRFLLKSLVVSSRLSRLSVGTQPEYLVHALAGKPKSMDDVLNITGTPETLRNLIAAGYYPGCTIVESRSLYEETSLFIPQMTIVQLIHFSARFPLIKSPVDLMFDAELPDFKGRPFEQWHVGTTLL
jgi:hypothetical protein